MVFFAAFIIILMIIVFCVIIIRYKGFQAYTELKTCFINISDHYQGSFHDTKSLENISMEFNYNKSHIMVKTVVTRQRKYTNEYSILICITDNNKRVFTKKIGIKDALHNGKLLSTISSMLAACQASRSISIA